MLLGLAVGDALGTTLEFTRPKAPAFPALAAGPHISITGGGPFGVAAGQVTDDTQMATCLYRSLVELGHFDEADVAVRYVQWRNSAFDIGSQTRQALSLIANGVAPHLSGMKVWTSSGKAAAGNGSLMRTAPITAYFGVKTDARRNASLADSAITHYDPRCRLACAGFNGALAAAAAGDSPDRVLERAEGEIRAASELLQSGVSADDRFAVTAARNALLRDLGAAREDDPRLYGEEESALHITEHQGFVRIAFRLAFWEALHAPAFERGLIDVVNRGGDADTNGAIAGALLGALHGASSIPAEWRKTVLNALAGSKSPLATTYHPRVFVEEDKL